MNLSSPLTMFFILLILQQTLIPTLADRKFIENTCKTTPSFDLCLKILLTNPKSQNADLKGLALIGVAAVKFEGDKIIQQISGLKKSRPELKSALDNCAEVYHTVVYVDVPMANVALRLGNPKFAENGMADSAVEAQSCESSFGEHGLKSPMTGLNNEMNDIANVVRAIVSNLL